MDASVPALSDAQVTLHPVDQSNGRAIARLKVFENQREFVAEPSSLLGALLLWTVLATSCYLPGRSGNRFYDVEHRYGKWELLAWGDPD